MNKYIPTGGRLTWVTNALSKDTRYAYNKDGLRTDVWYVRNSSEVNTHYTYYQNHLLKTTDYPGFNGARNVTTNYYDGNGNLIQTQDARLTTKNYTFDNNNRLILKTYPNLSTVAYSYDARSNLLTTLDANTNTENAYDDLSRLITVTNKKYPYPYKVIAYEYYEDGLRKKMTSPENDVIEYGYDKAKRLLTVKRNSTTQETNEYNALSQNVAVTYGNSSVVLHTYNNVTRWLTGVYNQTSTNTIISSFVYTHDLIGNRKSMTLANGDVISYTFDATYQLVNELRSGRTAYQRAWTYDEVGNRLTQWNGTITTTYTYNDANQLTQEITGGTTTTYQFDANGNQTGKTIGANTWVWGYDYENRQISYTDPVTASNNATYTYNAGGARVTKTVNSVTEKYVLDGANVIVDYDANNVVSATYVTPFLDQNLLMVRGGNTYYYMQDGLGSIRNLIDQQQTTKNSYDYYAFGEILSQTENIQNRYKFTAREWDSESQTYYYRARQYSPYMGRFMAIDPLEYLGGINLYSYVGNNAQNHIDPNGLFQSEPPEIEANPNCPRCGADITEALQRGIQTITQAYQRADANKRVAACTLLRGPRKITALLEPRVAWDFQDLVDYKTPNKGGYLSLCRRRPYNCASGSCWDTVEVDGKCYHAGSVNYVLYGTLYRICSSDEVNWNSIFFGLGYVNRYTKKDMHDSINLWKTLQTISQLQKPANWDDAISWADAGYDGWAGGKGVKSPSGDAPAECTVGGCGFSVVEQSDLNPQWSGIIGRELQ